jgi:hypothetical protein
LSHLKIDPEESLLIDDSLRNDDVHIRKFANDPFIKDWCLRNGLNMERCGHMLYNGEASFDEFVQIVGSRTDLEAIFIKRAQSGIREEKDVLSPACILSLEIIFGRNKNLRALLINGHIVDVERSEILSNMVALCPRLELLDLFDNCMSNHAGYNIVRSLLSLPNLKEINFGDNLIDASGREEILRYVHQSNSTVRTLF